ncbi:hypothetical protein MYX04_05735 [Nitrospiraceae bacterium AH_259_D15_M11_P09]|nr:hypothetical protein [Nitrospiraceae bacterium AH_259_D15_M11_P09]
MDTFDQRVEQLEQRKGAAVAEAKKGLAATRNGAQQGLKDFEKVAAKLRPGLDNAWAKHQRATAAGVFLQALHAHLEEVSRIMEGAPAAYKDLIRRIDGLTDWEVYQNIPLRLPGELAGLSGGAVRLEWLAKMVEQDVQDLAEVLKNATAGVAVMVPAERQASGPPVEKDFEV